MSRDPLLASGLLAVLAACGGPDAPVDAQDAPTTRVFGNVVYAREAPPIVPLVLTREETQACCDDPDRIDRADRDLVVDPSTRGIANAVVTLDVPGAGFEVPSDPLEVVAVDCRFEPHVSVLPAGAELAVTWVGESGYQPYVHGIGDAPAAGEPDPVASPVTVRPRRPGAQRVACATHPWMEAWVLVTGASHFTVTDASGSFAFDDVPPGTYRMTVWHEKLGTHVADVVVLPNAPPEAMRITLDRPGPDRLRDDAPEVPDEDR